MENINNKVTIKYLVNELVPQSRMFKKFPGFIFTDIEEQGLRVLKPRPHSVLTTHTIPSGTHQREWQGQGLYLNRLLWATFFFKKKIDFTELGSSFRKT